MSTNEDNGYGKMDCSCWFLCLTACSTGLVVPDGTSFEDRYDTLARLDRALIAVDVSERSRQLASEYRHLFGRSRDIRQEFRN